MIPQKIIRKIVKLSQLESASYNPKNRTAAKNIKALADSMELIGLLHPITTDDKNNIIDGHRRVAAAKLLGWKEIECNVVDKSREEVYASVNVTSRPMSGNDALNVWLGNELAAPAKFIPQFRQMEAAIGRALVERIAAAGLSQRVFYVARRIARYCDDEGSVAAVTEWLVEFPVVGQVRKAMEAGVSPGIIMKAVKAKKPVKLSLAVA